MRFARPCCHWLRSDGGELIVGLERAIHAQHRASDDSQRLESVPGIGVIGATAIAATVTDPLAFRSGRHLAAWIGDSFRDEAPLQAG